MTNEISLAQSYIRIKAQLDELTAQADELKAQLRKTLTDGEASHSIPTDIGTVTILKPKPVDTIAAPECGQYLIEQGRQADLLSVIKIEKSQLGSLIDGAELIAQFARVGRVTEATVTIKRGVAV